MTVHLNTLHALKDFVHVSLVVPGLHIQQDGGFGDNGFLSSFLLMVSLQPLLGDPLLLLGLLLVAGSKKINIVVIVSGGGGGGRSSSATKRESGACFWELFHSGAKRLDVVVPAKGMSILGCSS